MKEKLPGMRRYKRKLTNRQVRDIYNTERLTFISEAAV